MNRKEYIMHAENYEVAQIRVTFCTLNVLYIFFIAGFEIKIRETRIFKNRGSRL